MKRVTGFNFLDSKITVDGDCSYEIKRHLLLRRTAMTKLDSVLKSRDITLPTKICRFKAMVFPIVMMDVRDDHKQDRVLKNWRFQTIVLEKTLEGPLDCKVIKPVNPKGNQHWIFIGRTDSDGQYFGHLMWRADWLEKTPVLGKIGGKRKRGNKWEWDGWMASPTWWTWVWASSSSSWWTGKPGVLQFMGLQRVGYYWGTE